ncbi:MAG: phage tail protein [Flavobacteriales bacterium]|nr:phage tail protein [Flavobacteriales bacterium]
MISKLLNPVEAGYYPPLGFHFRVNISGLDDDSKFQSISGLSTELEIEVRKEGGENQFEHILPVRSKYTPLVLKRGLMVSSKLLEWCSQTFTALGTKIDATNRGNQLFTPRDLTIHLLNEKHEPLMSWNVIQALPKKWSITDFNAEQSNIVIETLEFQYQYYTVVTAISQ